MATTNTLKPLLDRKSWEMCNPCPTSSTTGMFVIADPTGTDKDAMFVTSVALQYLYDHNQDGFVELPTSGIAGTFAAGACGTFHPVGPNGTASAGTTTTLTTTLTIPRDLAGFTVRITGGTNAGQTFTIASNTFGANAVLTFTGAAGSPFDNTSVYTIMSGRYWFFNAGTVAVGFKYWDRATNAWSAAKSVTNLPTAWATNGALIATPSTAGAFATGTATAGSTTTLTNSGKAWTVNQWTNYQVRITAGAGAGKVATITSNTATVLSFANIGATLDNTSVYSIEGNDDNLYLLGNAAVTMYKYSISGDTWAVMAPTTARAAAPGAGMGANWIAQATDTRYTTENTIQNGRYIYSFRGGATGNLDYFDIAGGTAGAGAWTNLALAYGNAAATFTLGSSFATDTNYIYASKDATGRCFRYDVPNQTILPFNHLLYPDSTAIEGVKLWVKNYVDGGTTLKWVYRWSNTGQQLLRCLVI